MTWEGFYFRGRVWLSQVPAFAGMTVDGAIYYDGIRCVIAVWIPACAGMT